MDVELQWDWQSISEVERWYHANIDGHDFYVYKDHMSGWWFENKGPFLTWQHAAKAAENTYYGKPQED